MIERNLAYIGRKISEAQGSSEATGNVAEKEASTEDQQHHKKRTQKAKEKMRQEDEVREESRKSHFARSGQGEKANGSKNKTGEMQESPSEKRNNSFENMSLLTKNAEEELAREMRLSNDARCGTMPERKNEKEELHGRLSRDQYKDTEELKVG